MRTLKILNHEEHEEHEVKPVLRTMKIVNHQEHEKHEVRPEASSWSGLAFFVLFVSLVVQEFDLILIRA